MLAFHFLNVINGHKDYLCEELYDHFSFLLRDNKTALETQVMMVKLFATMTKFYICKLRHACKIIHDCM